VVDPPPHAVSAAQSASAPAAATGRRREGMPRV
jgi:hypothetical protein